MGRFLGSLLPILGRWVAFLLIVWVYSAGLALGKTLTHASRILSPLLWICLDYPS